MAPKIPNDCYSAANEASGGKLTRDEIQDAYTRIMDEKERLQRSGQTDRMADRLKSFAEREAERTKVAAALQKRHAALNILVRDRLDRTIDAMGKAGLPPHKALLAIMEGTQRGVEGGRNSVAAMKGAYESRYVGGMFADLQKDVPYWQKLLDDKNFDQAVLREMGEIKEGGNPGLTGNKDAKKVADIFARYAELSRTDLNKLGASIGKLDGWAGAQTHDDVRMIQAGKDAWVNYILPRLDLERTFDGAEPGEVKGILGDVYDTIITGVPSKATAKEKGQRVNPANLAKSLGKSRVLHFKDATAALQYRDAFGYGTTVSGIAAHLRKAAGLAAQMETFGPNPEVMFDAIVESQKRRIKEGNLPDVEKDKLLKALKTDGGKLRNSFDIMSGLATRPVSVTASKIGADIRAVTAMAKLGGAVITSIPSDTVTNAIASQFRGSGFFRGLTKQLGGILQGRGKSEQREIAYLFGEGFDGLIGHIVNPAAAVDGPVGRLSRLQDTFFKLNGLNWWTDVSRATAARTIAAEMGMRSATAYDALPANYRHVLGLHGIDAARWDVIRKAGTTEVNGNKYITPDLIRNLDDADVEPLVADRLKPEADGSIDPEKRAKWTDDARRDLELKVLAFVADEVNYGVIETDAASRRITTMGGLRPGTFAGEAVRYIMQFKGFPIAFAQRVVGRAFLGQRADMGKMAKMKHIGTMMAGLTAAGYMAMTMKDVMRGNWPPRDPTDPKTILASMQQGGALGIYGDFLFGEVNRFGGGLTETLAGPTVGSFGDLANLLMKARDAGLGQEDAKAADFLNFGLNNTPFINLFYTRPVLDYLFINAAREWATPGYLKRSAKRRLKDYGQKPGGPMAFARGTAF